jgi:parvulin-like peptidyl-prolyl isomerase
MRKCSFALVLLSACAWTQSLPVDDPKEAVVAVVNGRKITLSEYKRILEAQDPTMRTVAERQPKAFLEQYALFENVLTAAEKAGLDQQTPFKERIAASRKQILITGFIDEKHKNFVLPPDEPKKFYAANPDMYQQAMVKVIFISRMTETRNLADKTVTSAATPEEIKAKVEKAAKLAREGVDFGKVALDYSDDQASAQKGGVFPHPIRPTSGNVPPNIRQPILAAKAGDIVGPIEHDAGYYIFKIDSNGIAPFDQVKDDIVKEMKDARLKHWLDEFKKSSSVTISNESLLTEAAKSK